MDCDYDVCTNNIIIEKSVDKGNAIVGDVLKYSIRVINKCNILIDNI